MKRFSQLLGNACKSAGQCNNEISTMPRTHSRSQILIASVVLAAFAFEGCTVGPKYQRPTAPAPAAYKELTPADYSKTDGWKVAQPQDNVLHGKWWTMFNDPQLNALEEQVDISNQNIQSAMASYMAARAIVKEARSQYYPTVTVGPSITGSREGAAASLATTPGTSLFYSLPFDATWVPDLWGRVRNQVRANTASAQASAADLENARLTAQAEVAVDYYSLRGQDDLKQLLDSTVIAFQESLDLTKALYETGIDSDEAVAQAETQLETTQAQATNLGILR
jgi:outer membrane protein TolC